MHHIHRPQRICISALLVRNSQPAQHSFPPVIPSPSSSPSFQILTMAMAMASFPSPPFVSLRCSLSFLLLLSLPFIFLFFSRYFPSELSPVQTSSRSSISITAPNLSIPVSSPPPPFSSPSPSASPSLSPPPLFTMNKKCNIYEGRWVRDETNRTPLYPPKSCPYVDEAFACMENGRPDEDFLKWRWEPFDCALPRLNATDFLVRLRGKRLLLVGDSMNRNQFESLLCVLREALPDKSKMYETRGYRITKGRGYFIFKFVDYDCTVEFVRSHYLVREGTRINRLGNSNPTLSIDQIDKSAKRWKRADFLIFNTGHWWTHGKTAKGKNYYQEGGVLYPKFDAVEAYRRAIRTWGQWIDRNLDPTKTTVFYRGYSTAHFRGGDWDSGGSCNGEQSPILSGPIINSYPIKMRIVQETIHKMRFPVILLNVTKLTNYRKDGHPSIYGKLLKNGQKKVSRKKQDCSHWCLPGVPDTWNELIYATLVLQGRDKAGASN